jgi:hypothetical protein
MSDGLAINWTTLALQETRAAVGELDGLPEVVKIISGLGTEAIEGRLIHNVSTPIAKASALAGPAKVVPTLRAVLPAIAQTAELLDASDPGHTEAIVDAVLFLNLVETHGIDPPPALAANRLTGLLESLPGNTHESDDPLWLSAAFAALSRNRPDLVSRFTGLPLPVSIEPNQKFEIDLPAFLVSIAAAVEKGADFALIKDAWLNYVSYFPVMLAASEAEWPQLFAAARGVLAYSAGVPSGQIADSLHKLIMQMIGAGL